MAHPERARLMLEIGEMDVGPEEEGRARTLELETTTAELPLAVALLAAVAVYLIIYLGKRRVLTWLGTGLFLAILYGITWICDRAVLAQREKFRRERRGIEGGEAGAETASRGSPG